MSREEEEWFSMPGRGGEDREDEPDEEASSSSSSSSSSLSEEWGSKEREESTSPSMVEESSVVLKRSRVGVSDSGVSMSSSVGSSKEGDTVPLLKPLSGAMIVLWCRDFLVECEGGVVIMRLRPPLSQATLAFPFHNKCDCTITNANCRSLYSSSSTVSHPRRWSLSVSLVVLIMQTSRSCNSVIWVG